MNIGKSLEDYLESIYILWKRKGTVRSILLIIWIFQNLV